MEDDTKYFWSSKWKLFNIITGRAFQRDEEEYLLTIKYEDKRRRDAHIKKFSERTSWFEELIKKVKILNCAAEFIRVQSDPGKPGKSIIFKKTQRKPEKLIEKFL